MKSDDQKTRVGERLQRFREIRGLNRAVLAQRLGITERELDDLEAGKRELTKENLETLRETFALDAAWLLAGEDE